MTGLLKYIACAAMALSMAGTSFAVPGYPGDPSSGAYLGVMVEKISPETAAALHLSSGGTAIENVDQDGPACRAGMKGGDIVSAFNGKPVSGPDQFASMIHASAPGSTVTLTVWRNGKSQEMKVKLGDWKKMAALPPVPAPSAPLSPVSAMPFAAPMPPDPPDVDIHLHTPMIARSGIVVEPLSSQLCEFFGVPPNKGGVLVRAVEKGTPGASAGLKAGDVIVKVNNETIHDMADWKRALNGKGKLSVTVVRDKREQNLQMTLPPNTSMLNEEEWKAFEQQMREFSAQMDTLEPQFEAQAKVMAKLDTKQMEAMRKQVEESLKAAQPEMERQAKELAKHAAEMTAQSEQMRQEMAKYGPEFAKQAREMADQMKPSAEEMQKAMKEFERQWKEQEPRFQKQMEDLKKQMQEWHFEWSSPKQL